MDIDAGELYFVREIDPHTKTYTRFVKIGLVKDKDGRDSHNRLSEHQTGNPRILDLPQGNVLHTDAITRVESQMHKLYANCRVSGEWFEFATEDEVEAAKTKAAQLAAEVAKYVPIIVKAGEWSKHLDNGTVVAPTSKAKEIISRMAIARSKLKALKALEAEIDGMVKAAVEKGEDVAAVATPQVRAAKDVFDAKAFKAAEPEIYEKYLVKTQAFTGRFLPTVPTVEESSLDAEFQATLTLVRHEIEMAKTGVVADVNHAVLVITAEAAVAKWDEDLAAAELQIECGDNEGIEGICTWKRFMKENEKFDEANFKAENPDLAKRYTITTEAKTVLKKNRKKSE